MKVKKKVKIKASYNTPTIIAGILSGTLGFFGFGPLGAIVVGGIVTACCHGSRKDAIKYETNKLNIAKEEDELFALIKKQEPQKKKITINTFSKNEYEGWYERKALYKN